MKKHVRLIALMIGWFGLVAGALFVTNAFTFRLFYVLSFLGFLVISGLATSSGVTISSRRAISVFTVLGFVGFLYLIYQQLLEVLPARIL